MNSQNIIFIIFLSLIYVQFIGCKNKSKTKSTLVLLQIIHRHGDRTPIAFYPNDPYKGDNWVDGLGELTLRGKHRMYNFGQQLRQRYGNYLGDSPKDIYVRSSASNRCIESASALVSGLYPPKNRWIWSSNDSIAHYWQPIAVQTVLKTTDGLLVTDAYCPAADAAYEEIMRSKEVIEFMSSQKEFIKQIEEKTGQKFHSLRELDYLYNTIETEMSFDEPKPVPKWVEELGNNTLERLKQFETNAFKYDWSSYKIKRLRSGLILQELINNMKSCINSSDNTKKVYSYSSHDTLIVAVLQSLGLYSGIPPSFGSALLFELHQIDGQYLVHLHYANVTPVLNYKQLDLKVCRLNTSLSDCHLNRFIDSVNEFIPNNWTQECELSMNTEKSLNWSESQTESVSTDWFQDKPFIVVIAFIAGVSTVLGFGFIKRLVCKQSKPKGSPVFYDSYLVNRIYSIENFKTSML